MEDKILNYLANGLAASQVATLVGCSPAYISQLMSKDEFKARLKQSIIDNPTAPDDKLDDKYTAVETALLNSVEQAIPGAELPAITMALKTIAGIRHDRHMKKNPLLTAPSMNIQYVQLTMPNHVVRSNPIISLNEKSEIIAIDNQPMAPLSSDGVKNLFEGIRNRQESLRMEISL